MVRQRRSSGILRSRSKAERVFPVLIESEPDSAFCFDAFSSCEPVSTSLEDALADARSAMIVADQFRPVVERRRAVLLRRWGRRRLRIVRPFAVLIGATARGVFGHDVLLHLLQHNILAGVEFRARPAPAKLKRFVCFQRFERGEHEFASRKRVKNPTCGFDSIRAEKGFQRDLITERGVNGCRGPMVGFAGLRLVPADG